MSSKVTYYYLRILERMKYFWFMFSFALFLTSFNCHAHWKDRWSDAIIFCKEQKYVEAESCFNDAIVEMEQIGDIEHPYVYVDRARLYLLLDRNEEVLPDVDKAISSTYLTLNDRIRAVVTRLMARSRLNMEEEVLEDLNYFGEINKENMPKKEVTEKYIIIRNIPDCECYKNVMKCYYIHSGICKSKNDIQITDSGTCIIKKSCDCGCMDITLTRSCDACGKTLKADDNEALGLQCKNWCNRSAVAGSAWCAKMFKRTWCQIACATAVYELQQACHWCCAEGNAYKKCIKPFEDILAAMGNVCDPVWD